MRDAFARVRRYHMADAIAGRWAGRRRSNEQQEGENPVNR